MATIAQHQPAVIIAGRRMSHSASKHPKTHEPEPASPITTDDAVTVPTPSHDDYPRPANGGPPVQHEHKLDYAPFDSEDAPKKKHEGKWNAEAVKAKMRPDEPQNKKDVARGGRIVQPVREVDI